MKIEKEIKKEQSSHQEWLASIERGLKRASEEASKVARFYGTPIYIQDKNGKIIALKPDAKTSNSIQGK